MKNTIIALVLTAGILWAASGTKAETLFYKLVSGSQELLFDREVQVVGLQKVSEEFLESKLPYTKSNIYWHLFAGEIEQAISSNPWVKSAQLGACDDRWFSCYRINLVERLARYQVQVGEVTWLVDDSGNFLSAVSEDQYDSRGHELIQVESLSEEQNSPDIARARLLHLSKVIDSLEREVALKIDNVKYMKGGDLVIHFAQDNFDAIFSAEVVDPAVLRTEVGRFKKVLGEFEGKTSAIAKVDLAFDRSVVVKTKESSQS